MALLKWIYPTVTAYLGFENQADKYEYKKRGYPQGKGKDAGTIDKCLPWKVRLGDREQAISMLEYCLGVLRDGEDALF